MIEATKENVLDNIENFGNARYAKTLLRGIEDYQNRRTVYSTDRNITLEDVKEYEKSVISSILLFIVAVFW